MMSAKTRQLRYRVIGFTAGVLALGLLHFHLRADTRPVVLSGQPAPGAVNARFKGFNQASVNSSGDMAFFAKLDVGGVETDSIFKVVGGVLSPVAIQGQLLPDSSRQFLGLREVQINNSGDVVFKAYFTGGSPYVGIFLSSGGTLRKMLDQATPIPGAPGLNFADFDSLRINDAGDIAFEGEMPSNDTPYGIFLLSHGSLQTVRLGGVGSTSIGFNNNGDIVFSTRDGGLSLYSDGALNPVVTQGQRVPNSNLVIQMPQQAWINDARDIVFLNSEIRCCTGRGGGGATIETPAMIRWRGGTLEKVFARGDDVPGLPGRVFDLFTQPEANRSAMIFGASTLAANGLPSVGLIGKVQNAQWSFLVSGEQMIEGIGPLSLSSAANVDNADGSWITFLSNIGPISSVVAQFVGRYTLLFPQIADGTSPGGGWHTTFVFANRSTTPASVQVNLYGDNGAPMNVGVDGRQQSTASITVPALGVAQIQTDGTGPLMSGWANAQADQNISGIAIFGFYNSAGKLANEVGAAAAVPLRSMSVFVQADSSTSTGVALANPNASSAELTLVLRDSNSTEVARTTVTIPPNGHLAKYVGELFPSTISGEFEGKLDLSSTQTFIALTLRQRESVFTSLPVIP